MNTIRKEDLFKMEKASTRQALIDIGMYCIHKEKVYRDKTKYSRKIKFKNKLDNSN